MNYNQEDIVCDCIEVTVKDIQTFLTNNPNASLEETIDATEAGSACECCLESDCPKIDTVFIDVFNHYKN